MLKVTKFRNAELIVMLKLKIIHFKPNFPVFHNILLIKNVYYKIINQKIIIYNMMGV